MPESLQREDGHRNATALRCSGSGLEEWPLVINQPAALRQTIEVAGLLVPAAATAAVSTAAAATATAAATTTPAAATTASAALFARTSFVDREDASVEFLRAQLLDRFASGVVIAHLNEPETLAPAGVAIHDHLRAPHGAEFREQFFQPLVGHRIAEISHIQFHTHLTVSDKLHGPWTLSGPK
jgi:hypothetical protein